MKIVDMFCGAGGESTGILQACAELNEKVDLLAINHWDVAIATHQRNHPDVKHLCESIQNIDPLAAVPGGRLNLLWASPECTHHSNARGGRPRSNQKRASAWLILKWLQELYVEKVIIENVPEFLNWGPIGANGQPLKSKKGETFNAFVKALGSLGYKVGWRVLCAADYGVPTTRKRLFVQAVRGRNKIIWPEITHEQSPDMFVKKQWRSAKDVIDWNNIGKSIFNRKKPLAENTVKRIEAGIQKFWGEWAEPFLIVLRGTGGARGIKKSLPTVTTSGSHYGIVEPLIVHQMTCGRTRSVNEPLPTITTINGHGLLQPFISILRGQSKVRDINSPCPTISCSGAHLGVVRPFVGMGNVKSDIVLDIRFRMLTPDELALAQGFPENYEFEGNRAEKVKQIGNAVPCGLAKAIAKAVLAA